MNVIAPGWIDTSFAATLPESRRREIAESAPLGRWGHADDVAGAAVFLASPAAAFRHWPVDSRPDGFCVWCM